MIINYILQPTLNVWSVTYSQSESADKSWISLVVKENIPKLYKKKWEDDTTELEQSVGINNTGSGDGAEGFKAKIYTKTLSLLKIPVFINDLASASDGNVKIIIDAKPKKWFPADNDDDDMKIKYKKLLDSFEQMNTYKLAKTSRNNILKELKHKGLAIHSNEVRRVRKLIIDKTEGSPFYKSPTDTNVDTSQGGKRKTKRRKKKRKNKTKKKEKTKKHKKK